MVAARITGWAQVNYPYGLVGQDAAANSSTTSIT